jgi:hypothetical protein
MRTELFTFTNVPDTEANFAHRMRHYVSARPGGRKIHGGKIAMFRKPFNLVLSLLLASVLATALATQTASAQGSKVINADMDIVTATSLGGKPVKPGTYRVVADGSTVTLKRGNKVIAEAPAEWKDADSKANYSSVVTDGQGITQFHFEGKESYIQVKE